MLFRNYTPFPPLQFESRDEKQNDFGVIALRGTFKIENGKRLKLVQEQEPLIMTDQYYGEPGLSSLKFESSIAPYKPKTDLLVTGQAHAPSRTARKQWNVGVEIGKIKKGLTVTGPREWLGGRLSPIKEVTRVPLRYELSYGGQHKSGKDFAQVEDNPVGTGFTKKSKPPQIFPFEDTTVQGVNGVVAGFGPIAPSWSPRREKAGTFNVIWEKTRWPDLPEDFSFEFYNTASEGLTLPGFVEGSETITLTNLAREEKLVFALPKFQLATLLRFHDGRLLPAPINLDTIHIELDSNRVYLTWRGVHPIKPPLRVLEVRMKAPEDVIDKATARLDKDIKAEAHANG